MTKEQYKTIWEQTEKAAAYLRRKNVPMYMDSTPSGYGVAVFEVAYASNADVNAMAHVRGRYPLAKVVFIQPEQVDGLNAVKAAQLRLYLAQKAVTA